MENKVVDINKESLANQVFSHIKKMILSGQLKQGERIIEKKIADSYGVSRTPIREALKKLNEYGLVDFLPRRQAVVSSISESDAKHIAEVRAQLESLSIRLFIEIARQEDINQIEAMVKDCNRLVTIGDLSNIFEKDSQLHLEIAKKTGNRFLYDCLEKIDIKVQLLRLTVCKTLHNVAHDVSQHDEILKMIKLRDVNSAILHMREHILQHFSILDK